jgi:hypothetical protein
MPAPASFNRKSYQAPCAGKARALANEVEQDYEKAAKVATPAGYFQVNALGGKKQPTIDTETMNDEGMGKKPAGVLKNGVDLVRKPVKSAYNVNSNNASNV